jgi:aspartyl-tRNA(Asn)/glutamyl-tRNA(Gln) amidotransferase subunit C
MITKEKLEDYAKKLMFEMNDDEYQTLLEEFDIILKQMDLIGKIENIKDIEPMTFPFPIKGVTFREDIPSESLSTEDVLKNAKVVENSQVKVPKVVE